MNNVELTTTDSPQPGADLLELQLQIARRADELAKTRRTGRSDTDDRKNWLEAEREILARFHRAAFGRRD